MNYHSHSFINKNIDLLHDFLNINRCFIALPDRNKNLIIRYASTQTLQQELCLNPCYLSAESHSPDCHIIASYYRENVTESANFLTADFVTLEIPLHYQNRDLGILVLQDCDRQSPWSQQEIKIAETIAENCALALYQEQIEVELQQQKEIARELVQKNQQKNENFSMMSHDLRSPLTGIVGLSQMLVDCIYGDLNPKQMEYIRAIASSSKHLLNLINDLLDLAKIEANREELYLETLSIEEVCLASISMIKQLANARGLELKLEIAPDISTCMADQHRLKRILVNLLSNAIKFTESGSILLKVDRTRDRGESLLLKFSVIDTGIGIAAADIEKLFQPFTQIQNRLQRRQKGTGLGLALSKKLAQLHGGDLSVTSELEKGSCFTLYLPLGE
ncbi:MULTISPECIES: ATP-binding protein [Spirulina sp. CCY15215]|uniref:sensor histidine kinase n=1 Tax=Spirulina sp. CCY15215 TaxID=2767591 RepID=UPI00194EBD30